MLKIHSGSEPHDISFDYRSVIGKLEYLDKGSQPYIECNVHQCRIFTSEPKKDHAQDLIWLGRYLKGTRDKGTLFRPKTGKYPEVYVDANFDENWNKYDSLEIDIERSIQGYIIMFTG